MGQGGLGLTQIRKRSNTHVFSLGRSRRTSSENISPMHSQTTAQALKIWSSRSLFYILRSGTCIFFSSTFLYSCRKNVLCRLAPCLLSDDRCQLFFFVACTTYMFFRLICNTSPLARGRFLWEAEVGLVFFWATVSGYTADRMMLLWAPPPNVRPARFAFLGNDVLGVVVCFVLFYIHYLCRKKRL